MVAAPLLPDFPGKAWALSQAPLVRGAAAFAGLLGVFCSVMVYVATRREQWSFAQTGLKFFSTTFLLGCASVLAVSTLDPRLGAVGEPSLLQSVIIAMALFKLVFEGHALTYATDRRTTALKRMALVMRGELRGVTGLRFVLLVIGGLLLPTGLMMNRFPESAWMPVTFLILAVLLVGELSERYLFFRAAPASRMPGGLR